MDISFLMAVHMLTGLTVVSCGGMAIFLKKGSTPHKLAGRIFVGGMLLMGPVVFAGVWFSAHSPSPLGILFVFFIIYLVVSAWSTIHHSDRTITPLDIIAPVVAGCISISGLIMGYNAVINPSETENLPPMEAYFFFAALAFIAMLLDTNNLKQGGVSGKHRIVRHVWRMSCALFFATSSLFTGPGIIIFPEWLRGNPILSIPQFIVVILAIFWVWRLLFSKQQTIRNNTQANDSLDSNHAEIGNKFL